MFDWLSWLPNKRSFINSKLLDILKDSPDTPPSLKILEQMVQELVGKSTEPPS